MALSSGDNFSHRIRFLRLYRGNPAVIRRAGVEKRLTVKPRLPTDSRLFFSRFFFSTPEILQQRFGIE
jgi:hypothetical protein